MKITRLKTAALVFLAVAMAAPGSVLAQGIQPSAAPATGYHLVRPGFLTVGSDTTYPPMESRGAGNKFVGADIDLAQALAHAMGLNGAVIVDNSFDSLIPAMNTRHAFDVVMSSMNDTPERAKQIGFVDYMQASEGIVVKASSSIHANNYAGVCGKTVSVQSGTTEYAGMTQANKSCSRKINIKNFTRDTDAFQAFAASHADAYTGDLPVASLYVKQHSGALRLAGRAFGTGQKYGIGMAKNATALHRAIAAALQKIRASGQYSKILSRWGVTGASL